MKLMKVGVLIFFSLFFSQVFAALPATEQNNQLIKVELFVSSTCPHCEKASLFFKQLESEKPWLKVEKHIINEDKQALQNFYQHLQQDKSSNFTVPAIFFCDSHWMGFDTAETTGKLLINALDYCHQKILTANGLSQSNIETLKQWANAAWFEGGISNPPRALLFIPLMSLFDAFNPCSLFCLMGLFAFVFLVKDKKMQFLGGGLMVLFLSLIHYLSQVHGSFFYQLLAYSRIPAIIIGLSLLGYLYSYYFKIKDFKPILFVGIIALSLIVVQLYQQTCGLNFSLVFEQWLKASDFSPLRIKAYELIYNLIYLFALAIFLVIFIGLSRLKRLEKYKGFLQLAAFYCLFIIGFLLISYPFILSNLIVSVVLLIIIFISAFFIHKKGLMRIPNE